MLHKKLGDGIKGRIAWFLLDNKYRAEKYIFFPSQDAIYTKWGILMLPIYLKKNQIKKTLVLICDEKIEKLFRCLKSKEIVVKRISKTQMTQYLSYYALIDKSKKWVVVSVKQPYDTGAERMLGKHGITKKDIVYYDIYGFIHENIDKEIDKILEMEIEKKLLDDER